jgi:putative oxidoreductase
MKRFFQLLQLNFIPSNPDASLFVLRLWLGLSIALLHGWGKLVGFSKMAAQFPDPLGIGSRASLGLAVFAEFVCGLLIALGLWTRLAALVLAVNMAVAFFVVHKASLAAGPGSGELAYVYLAGFVAILIAGGGRYGLDPKV